MVKREVSGGRLRDSWWILALVVGLCGCRLWRDAELLPTEGVAAPRPVETRPALAAPAFLGPAEEWVIGKDAGLKLSAPEAAAGIALELALDEAFQLCLDRLDVDVSRAGGEPIEVPVSAELKPGDLVFARACSFRPDGARSRWATTRFRVALASPSIAGAPVFASAQTVEFSWSRVDGTVGYELEVLRDGSAGAVELALHVDDASTTSTKLPRPLKAGDYRLRVRGLAGGASGEWSDEHAFTVRPRPPEITAPRDGEDVRERTPLIEWRRGSSAAARCEVEIVALDAGGAAGASRLFPATGTSAHVPGELEPRRRYRVRVREGGDSGGWSAPVVFSVLVHSRDPFPVVPLLLLRDGDATHPAASPDGTLLAYVRSSVPVTAGDPEPPRRLELLERLLDGEEPRFRPLADAAAFFPGLAEIDGQVCHPTWAVGADTDPVLLVSTALCDGDAPVTEAPGALFRLHRLGDRRLNLHPRIFRAAILHPNAPPVGSEARIYFEARRLECAEAPDGPILGEIWSMKADGTGHRLHALGRDPAVSPDGRTVALVAARELGLEIHLLGTELAGAPSMPLVRAQDPSHRLDGPTWSPDGGYVAFARDEGSGFDLFAVAVATGEEMRLTESESDDLDPAFLPDPLRPSSSSEVVFSSNRSGRPRGLYAVRFIPGE